MNPTTQKAPKRIEALRAKLKGTLALPDEPGYEQCANWNTAVQVRPAAVIAVAETNDVVEVIRFAGAHGCRVAVHCSGHGAVALDGDDVLLIHTRSLDDIQIDTSSNSARVGAGASWLDVIDAAAEHGLMPIAGSAVGVGVAGFLSGGGIGPLVRTFGVSSDLVTAIDVVTGEGDHLHATVAENRDLFWGLRGGKATLGVICAVEVKLVECRQLYGGALYYDTADVERALHEWSRWSRDLPEHANTSLALLRLPILEGVPAPLAGRLTLAVRFASTESAAVCEPLLAAMRDAAAPVIDTVSTIPPTSIGDVHADPTEPRPVHAVSGLLRELPDAAIDALLAAAGPDTSCGLSLVELRLLGGAFARPGANPSAFCHRDAAFSVVAIGSAEPDDAAAIAADAEAVLTALESWADGGALPNFSASADPDAIRRHYDDATLLRLSGLADWYDPAGVLRIGQVVRDV